MKEIQGFTRETFTLEGKTIDVYKIKGGALPVVYLNSYGDEGEEVLEALEGLGGPKCHLVVIRDLNWNHDLVPWDHEGLRPKDPAFTGGADDYLSLLINTIVPEAEKIIGSDFPYRALAGYSLAGLFAIYAGFKTAAFERLAAASGSLWFKGFSEYVETHELMGPPKAIYFSLGDLESKTANPCLSTVEEKTKSIYETIKGRGIKTTFILNEGNHFRDGALRMAKGIKWILEA